MYWYDSNLGLSGAGSFWTQGPPLEKLGRGSLGMLHIKFLTFGHSGPEEEDFLMFFCVSMVRT